MGDTSRASGFSRLAWRVGGPVVALFVLNVAVVVGLLLLATQAQNRLGAESAIHLARSALVVAENQMRRVAHEAAVGDDAVTNLDTAFDPDWAAVNLGQEMYMDFNVSLTMLFAPDQSLRYVFASPPLSAPTRIDGASASLRRLIDAAMNDQGTPRLASGFVEIDGQVHVAAAAVVASPTPKGEPRQNPATVVVLARALGAQVMGEIERDYLLRGAHLQHTPKDEGAEESVAVIGLDGVPLAYMAWLYDPPGEAILDSLKGPLSLSVFIMALLLMVVLAGARRAGRSLDAAGHALQAANDALERRVAERTVELRAAEAKYRSIFEHATEGIFQTDPQGRYLSANPALARIYGYGSADEMTNNLTDIGRQLYVDSERRREFVQAMGANDLVHDFVAQVYRKDGSVIWISENARAVRGADGRVVYYEGTVLDVTDRKRAEERLIHDALHDALTQLGNRTLFLDRLAHVIERARRNGRYDYGVLFLDCDDFKLVNDSMGHGTGDELLVELGRRLSSHLREQDTLARLGGDEFAILVEDVCDPLDVPALAEAIQQTMRRPMVFGGREVFASVSIGIALGRVDYRDAGEILRDADIAMYQAKSRDRGQIMVFEAGMHQRAVGRMLVETDLRRAIDRGELDLFYQPIVRLADGGLAGFEALARWHHPERGMIPPDTFIPVAEETGLILPLGEWVLETACRQMQGWTERFGGAVADLFMSVNVSPVQLRREGIADRMAEIVRGTGIDAARLRLEITESAIFDNPVMVQPTLAQIKELGVRLSLDDFGTGYSSLSHLHTLPFDTLKIDRSFVSRLGAAAKYTEVVRAILMLGETFGMTVVAEGIETADQRERLRGMGCTYGQGYLFSRPVDAVATEALIRAYQTEIVAG